MEGKKILDLNASFSSCSNVSKQYSILTEHSSKGQLLATGCYTAENITHSADYIRSVNPSQYQKSIFLELRVSLISDPKHYKTTKL